MPRSAVDELAIIAVVAALLLLPLAPSWVLYRALSTPQERRAGGGNKATGTLGGSTFKLGGWNVRFSVVGSTATYVVLFSAASFLYLHLSRTRAIEHSFADRQAWLVEVPVRLMDAANQPLAANNGELQQVRVELEPALTQASANSIQFWVVPNNGRFPSARFSIPTFEPRAVDLNNGEELMTDPLMRRITGLSPVWLKLDRPYALPAKPEGGTAQGGSP